jgi:hypothetical protein
MTDLEVQHQQFASKFQLECEKFAFVNKLIKLATGTSRVQYGAVRSNLSIRGD